MKPPRYKGGGPLKGDPNKPTKTTIDRSKYAAILNKPIDGTNDNYVANDQSALNPAVLGPNGYQYVSGTMGGKDIVYKKGNNYFLYNEQPNAAENKYGLTNIGNPYAPASTNTPAPLKTSGQKVAPAVDPNRKPLNLSNPNVTVDPNTGNYYNPLNGTQIKPIVEQYKQGGTVKGYALGDEVTEPTLGTDYSSAFARVNREEAAKKEATQQAKQNKNAQYAQYAGNAITLGSQLNQNKALTGTEKQNADAAALQSTGDAISGSAIPILGLAKAAVGAGQNAFIDRDQYGYAKSNADKAGEEWSSAVTTDMWKDVSRKDYGAVAGDLLGAKLGRGLSQATGHGDQTTGGWGWVNRTTGLTAKNKRKAADIAGRTAGAINDEADARDQAWIRKQGELAIARGIRNDNQVGYSEGGSITGPGTGTSDSIKAKVKKGAFVVPKINAPIAEEIRKEVLQPTGKAKLNQGGGVDVRLSNGEHLFTKEEKDKIKMAGINISALAPDAQNTDSYQDGGDIAKKRKQTELRYLQTRVNNNAATGEELYRYKKLTKELGATTPTRNTTAVKAPKAPAKKTEIFSRNWAAQDPEVSPPTSDSQNLAQTAVPKAKTAPTVNGVDPNQASFDRDWAEATAEPTTKRKGFDSGKLIDYGIPLAQTALGLKYLKDAGKRPVDQLDPDYLKSIETAKGNVVTANAQAKFGFSPEEQAAIDMNNNNLTNSGRYAARNYSGGSAANALNMERSVINDSFARGLEAKAQNRNLIFKKQQIANDRQQYADSLITGKVGMSNRLFNQKMDAWNMSQQTGAGLIAAGLNNAIGAKQWQDELAASKERNAMYNPVTTI